MNPDFNCCNSFVLSLVDKVTTGRSSFVSVIGKVVTLSPSEIAQFADQVTIRLISQLIKSISRVLQKLLNYFNGTANFSFIMRTLLVLSKKFNLYFNDSDSIITLFGLSLENWYKFKLFWMCVAKFH